MTLAQLKKGETGIVTKTGGKNILRLRLLDMGLVPETAVTVTKLAPLGDPMEIFLRGYRLTLRIEDAKKIAVRLSEE